ncbi:GtrA family protein [Nakamurella sp. YIM 132087]|uniref:GtrA family protein n=1 Tax=Nakamurella alba TaxID=2665158 RepID=A0A7K1FJ31_9ACTN|nr:GtrA family protein [Nakamurella alba]MTD14141.1 GtrA family protein [Nakamurella alba]
MNLVERVREVLPPKYRELAKFLVVGGSSWVVDSGLFLILSHTILDEKVITSKIISILVSTIFSYILNREWSFSHRGGRERHHEAMLFFLVNGIGLLLNLVPLWISHYLIGISQPDYSRLTVSVADFVSGSIIGTLIGMAFRFWAYRRFVFPDELSSADEQQGTGGEPPVRAGS